MQGQWLPPLNFKRTDSAAFALYSVWLQPDFFPFNHGWWGNLGLKSWSREGVTEVIVKKSGYVSLANVIIERSLKAFGSPVIQRPVLGFRSF